MTPSEKKLIDAADAAKAHWLLLNKCRPGIVNRACMRMVRRLK